MALLAGIEAGGTKFNCAIALDPQTILAEARIPTTQPNETLEACRSFFSTEAQKFSDVHGDVCALGIGSFGPLNLDPQAENYGYITTTPKKFWENTDICGYFARELGIPVSVDTDVNAAALAEGYAGAARGLANFIYLTIGTGVGLGICVNGGLVHGLQHPEGGHILLPALNGDDFEGICPYHSRCFEGLCSGPAVHARWGKRAEELAEDHEAWDIQAFYIAEALVSFILTLSPQKIILGGGVMQQEHIFKKIRKNVQLLLNNYLDTSAIRAENSEYIVAPGLGVRSGLSGALVMAEYLYAKSTNRKK